MTAMNGELGVRIKIEDDLLQYLDKPPTYLCTESVQQSPTPAHSLFPIALVASGVRQCARPECSSSLDKIVEFSPSQDLKTGESEVNIEQVTCKIENIPRPEESDDVEDIEVGCLSSVDVDSTDDIVSGCPNPLEEMSMVLEVFDEGKNISQPWREKKVELTHGRPVRKPARKGIKSGVIALKNTSKLRLKKVKQSTHGSLVGKLARKGSQSRVGTVVDGTEDSYSNLDTSVADVVIIANMPKMFPTGQKMKMEKLVTGEEKIKCTGNLRKKIVVKENKVEVEECSRRGYKRRKAIKSSAIDVETLKQNALSPARVKHDRICKKLVQVNLKMLPIDKSLVLGRIGDDGLGHIDRVNDMEGSCDMTPVEAGASSDEIKPGQRNIRIDEIEPDNCETEVDGDDIEWNKRNDGGSESEDDKMFTGGPSKGRKCDRKAKARLKIKYATGGPSQTEESGEVQGKVNGKRQRREMVHSKTRGKSTTVKRRLSNVKVKEKCGTDKDSSSGESNGDGIIPGNKATVGKGKKPVPCEFCEDVFSNIPSLQKHWTECHGDRNPFKCSLCSEGFPTKKEMRRHKYHEYSKQDRMFPCQYCKSIFRKKSNMVAHERMHTGEKPYVCEECGKAFTLLNTLKRHRETHVQEEQFGSYSCHICGKVFGLEPKLKRHLTIHKKDRSHPCEICGKVFASRGTLSYHLKVHLNIRKYECPHCDAKFHKGSRLNEHLKHKKNTARLTCQYCDYVSPCSGTVTAHLVTHPEYLRHKKLCCSHCGQRFGKKRDLLRHAVSHLDKSEYPFCCSLCSKRYTRKDSLREHLKAVHQQLDFLGPVSKWGKESENLSKLLATKKITVKRESADTERMDIEPLQEITDLKEFKQEAHGVS